MFINRGFYFNMLKVLIGLSLFLEVMPLCQHATTISHFPNIKGIRLAGLGGVYYGRVEVDMNGEWGTICDDGWDNNDAKVVCRSLGMTGGIAYGRSWFDPGTGNITMTSVNCHGFERTLSYCSYVDKNCCSHREDAGVMCDEPK